METPKIMGILNVTPDSFFQSSRVTDKDVLARAEQMTLQEADILDIGGYSSRPKSNQISENEELNRVIPIIKTLAKHFPELVISVDTFRSDALPGACLYRVTSRVTSPDPHLARSVEHRTVQLAYQ